MAPVLSVIRVRSGLRRGPWGDRNIRTAMLGADGVDSAVSDGGRSALEVENVMQLSQIMTRGDWIRLAVLLFVTAGAVTWVIIEWQKPLLPSMV